MSDDSEAEPKAALPSAATGGAPVADDVVLLGNQSADGKSIGVVRLRDGNVEVGKVQPLEEGKPIIGEVVKLTPRADAPRVCDVEVAYKPPAMSAGPSTKDEMPTARTTSGPPQVATDGYRRNWDAIWARKKPGPPS
ncbi:MAG: hypothetical protein IPI67_05440 [Myxococcales bacterium]|nr:hypothetical protein [Myxococcales bacterium]